MLLTKPNFRIDTLEIKVNIIRKIGQHRAEKYFGLLKRFFSSKISKLVFDRLCITTIGTETIPLHNQLISSILKNAANSNARAGINITDKDGNGYKKNCFKSLLYGDAFSPSPRKARFSVCRDKKLWDRPSPLGPFGKPQSMVASEGTASKSCEQHSAAELISLGSCRPPPPLEVVVSVEEGEEVEQINGSPSVQSRSPVTAPLGISVNSVGPKKTLPKMSAIGGTNIEICQNGGMLPDTRSLRSCLLQKLETEDLKVSVESANLLNNALDAYLRRLIQPCLVFSKSRHGNFNGRFIRRSSERVNASMVDFSTAMKLNPQILREDWATELERISSFSMCS